MDSEALFPPPGFVPENHHLWKRVIADDGTHLNERAWDRCIEEGAYVGQCRHCGDYLRPERDDRGRADTDEVCRFWLVAVCVGCRHEFVAPDGKILKRSARHSQMPREFLRTRSGVIAAPRNDR